MFQESKLDVVSDEESVDLPKLVSAHPPFDPIIRQIPETQENSGQITKPKISDLLILPSINNNSWWGHRHQGGGGLGDSASLPGSGQCLQCVAAVAGLCSCAAASPPTSTVRQDGRHPFFRPPQPAPTKQSQNWLQNSILTFFSLSQE